MSEKGTVIDIIATEVYEEVKVTDNITRTPQKGFDRLVINRGDGEDNSGGGGGGGGEINSSLGGRNVVIHGGAKGAGLGAR